MVRVPAALYVAAFAAGAAGCHWIASYSAPAPPAADARQDQLLADLRPAGDASHESQVGDSSSPDSLPLLSCPPAQGFGGPAADYGYALAVDHLGNSFLAGSFRQTVDFGTGQLTAQGDSDIFIASYRGDGQARWARSFGCPSSLNLRCNHQAQSIALDSRGNVYLTGWFYREVDFGGGLLTAPSAGIFLASFTADGTYRWAQAFGDLNDDRGRAVAVDAEDNLYLAGVQRGTLDFGGGPRAAIGQDDIFVASFDAEGQHRWSQTFGSIDGHEGGYGLAVDPGGRLHLTGEFRGTIHFGDHVLSSNGYSDIFVASFDAAGQPLAARSFGGSGSDAGLAIASDEANNLYLTGYFTDELPLETEVLVSAGLRDAFLLALGAKLELRWAKRFGGNGPMHDEGRALTCDPRGNVFATGFFSGTADFADGQRTAVAFADLYLTSFTPDGAHRWTEQAGGSGNDYGFALAADASRLLLAGAFEDTVDFFGESLHSNGGQDIYLLCREAAR